MVESEATNSPEVFHKKDESIPLIRLEFVGQGLVIKNQHLPTVALGGILDQAVHTEPKELEKAEDLQVIEIDYDYNTDTCSVRSNASPVFYRGMFYMAQMMMIQMQLMGSIGKLAAAGGQPRGRIVRPGQA